MGDKLRVSFLVLIVFFASYAPHCLAQAGAAGNSFGLPEEFAFDANLRARYELVDWLEPATAGVDNQYNFSTLKGQVGLSYQVPRFKFYAQGQFNQAFDLPADAGGGTGALYRSFNGGGNSSRSIYLRQRYRRF